MRACVRNGHPPPFMSAADFTVDRLTLTIFNAVEEIVSDHGPSISRFSIASRPCWNTVLVDDHGRGARRVTMWVGETGIHALILTTPPDLTMLPQHPSPKGALLLWSIFSSLIALECAMISGSTFPGHNAIIFAGIITPSCSLFSAFPELWCPGA